MGKHDVGTPKWIDNRQKAKGLNKLRWYCQMCQKTCRDENGFKCHIMSESHARQLQMFNENPASFVDKYSKDFLEGNEDFRRAFCPGFVSLVHAISGPAQVTRVS